ncbi:MAG: hypothetical protein ABUT39_19295, partial [Acidobacteriota bacterium]
MILRDRYDGGSSPLEGDRELVLRRLPADARVIRARATVTPLQPVATAGGPFVETLAFRENAGDWGATKSAAAGWVEVDFHARRTVVGLSGQLGPNVGGPAVQADLGGGFVAIGEQGTFLIPPQTALTVSGSSAVLPSLTATRLRLFGTANQALDITAVRVRSAPSGVRFGLENQPALWFHTGELTRPETTPDFGPLLQAYLDDAARTEDGVWLLPFVLHSDALGRLALDLEIEYLRRASVMPGGVRDAALAFDHGGVPKSGGELRVSVPGNSRVASASGRVTGAFESTRVAFAPTGSMPPITPAGDLSLPAGSSAAHAVVLPDAVEAVAVDLLLTAIDRTVRLQLDLRLDLDGKPAGESILPAPVPFPLDREVAGHPTWVSVKLATPLQLPRDRKTWLLVQSLEGEAAWSVEAAAGALPPMQLTRDGGFSWRQASIPSGPVLGLFRLRSLPGTFKMPIELRVGEKRVTFERFEPQGKVDLSLDLPEIATAFNQALESAPRCPEADHLDNGDFEEWIRTGSVLGRRTTLTFTTQEDASIDEARMVLSADGRQALVATRDDASQVAVRTVDLGGEKVVQTVRLEERVGGRITGLAIDPGGARAWTVLTGSEESRIWIVDLENGRSVGAPLALGADPVTNSRLPVSALAVSPDGGTLYLALSSPNAGLAVRLNARRLEEAVLREDADIRLEEADVVRLPVLDPAALAVSPDGARLHILGAAGVNGSAPARTEVVPVDTATLRLLDSQARELGA